MSYYSDMAIRIADVDKRVNAALRAKDNEIASLKDQMNTVLVSLRSKLNAATEVAEAVVAERDALINEVVTWKLEAANARASAEQKEVAWRNVSREAQSYVSELIGFRKATEGLTLEDVRLACKLKTMRTHEETCELRYDGYDQIVKVSFTAYPGLPEVKENSLWEFLREAI